MYSALKINGQKLCDLARNGETVERQARSITIHSIDAKKCELPTDYTLTVCCSSGTYIRTLCADIGNALGCGGAMATLRRTLAGSFSLENSHTIEEIEALDAIDRPSLLVPIESLFSGLDELRLTSFYERLCRNGCEIYLSKINARLELGQRVRLCSHDGSFFALGEVRDFDGSLAVKAIKLFDI